MLNAYSYAIAGGAVVLLVTTAAAGTPTAGVPLAGADSACQGDRPGRRRPHMATSPRPSPQPTTPPTATSPR